MKEFELKAGDKVFIREDLKNEFYGSCRFNPIVMSGGIHVIDIIYGDRLSMKGRSHGYSYTREMIDWDKTKELNTKQQYDFKDLVHFSEKAVRDGVASSYYLSEGILTVCTLHSGMLYSVSDQDSIDLISTCMDILKQEYEKQGVEFDDIGKPDFNDLIDVAVKAVKDDLLEINRLGTDFITANIPGNSDFVFLTSYRDKPQNFKSDIDDIKSLYTETFVIESEDDIKKIKEKATITLTNGSSSYVHVLCAEGIDCGIRIGDSFQWMGFFILKGATVTQKRGK